MKALGLFAFLLFASFHVVESLIGIVIGAILQTLKAPLRNVSFRLRRLDHPTDGKRVEFACKSPDAERAKEVYITGSFNQWLQAQHGQIHPYRAQRNAYGMEKVIVDGRVEWQKVLWLSPGIYEFKFVVGKNRWIGDGASGGQNLRVDVGP